MKGPESKLRNKIMKALKEEYPQGLFFHIHGSPYQSAGIPDILCCVDGHFIGLEVKMPGKKTTEIQDHFHSLIEQSKGRVAVITSVEEAMNFMTSISPLFSVT